MAEICLLDYSDKTSVIFGTTIPTEFALFKIREKMVQWEYPAHDISETSGFRLTVLEYCDSGVIEERTKFYIKNYSNVLNLRKATIIPLVIGGKR